MPKPPGLYESVITEALARALDERAEVVPLGRSASSRRLADHLADHALRALSSLKGDRAVADRIALVNDLAEVIERHTTSFPVRDDAVQPRLLTGIRPAPGVPLPPRPEVALSESALYVNANRERRLDLALAREIASADRIDLICAFLFWSGYRPLRPALRAHLAAGRPLRVLTTIYGRMTQARVLDELAALGAEIRISYEEGNTRLHAKAWLLHRDSGFSTAFVGSSNLSHAALTSGREWNVRLSQQENRGVLAELVAAFDNHWSDDEFVPYSAEEFGEALYASRPAHLRTVFALRARPYQQAVLDRLDAERALHGRHANLVVAATGTGKTVIAALDYRRLCAAAGRRLRLLFVAHRKEILLQSLQTFCHAMSDGSFGEEWVDGKRPHRREHVFASVQSLSRAELDWAPDHFEVVIVDEFHHAAAITYDKLLKWLRPAELLGLTATPERADGRSLLEWFGGRIASDLRLWDAIERGFLVPFQYFAVADGTDLRSAWRKGRYDVAALERLYTGDHVRAHLVVEALREHVDDVGRMRALGFCVRVDHARFMARVFEAAGIPSAVVTGETKRGERRMAVERLRSGEVRCLLTVDVFNEGVDIPEVDTVLFMRPTDSATVFLQQLGRGLRRCEGKRCLTVLDFVGQPHDGFRYADRFRALLGRMGRRQLKQQVEAGFPYLPSGCSMELDARSQELILENVSRSLRLDRRSLAKELTESGATSLGEFLDASGVALDELYRGGRCLTDLRRIAGLLDGTPHADERGLARGLGRLIHVDDRRRLRAWRRWLDGEGCDERLRLMLLSTLWGAEVADDLAAGERRLRAQGPLCAELGELIDVLSGALTHRTLAWAGPAPLEVHGAYRLNEVMAAFGDVRKGRLYLPREGVQFDVASGCNLLFVTLQKSEDDYSASTMYADHALGPRRFHWQSQSGTRATDAKGRRHVEHGALGVTPLLFVREHRKDERGVTEPYVFLGPVRLESWAGERPMDVIWQLEHPMPAELLAVARVVG